MFKDSILVKLETKQIKQVGCINMKESDVRINWQHYYEDMGFINIPFSTHIELYR